MLRSPLTALLCHGVQGSVAVPAHCLAVPLVRIAVLHSCLLLSNAAVCRAALHSCSLPCDDAACGAVLRSRSLLCSVPVCRVVLRSPLTALQYHGVHGSVAFVLTAQQCRGVQGSVAVPARCCAMPRCRSRLGSTMVCMAVLRSPLVGCSSLEHTAVLWSPLSPLQFQCALTAVGR